MTRKMSSVLLGNRFKENYYRKPYIFDKVDYSRSLREFAKYSNMIWSYFGYQGLLTPWHFDDLEGYLEMPRKTKTGLTYPLKDFLNKFSRLGISEKAYSVLLFIISDYTRFERPLLLLSQPDKFSWFEKLVSNYDKDTVELCANLVLKFVEKQVESHKRANINTRSIIDEDPNGGKYFKTYHIICDRVSQLKYKNLDINIWTDHKYKRILEAFPGQYVNIKTLFNVNGFDPTDEEMETIQNDPWLSIRTFLGVTNSCEFSDGSIPKGWRPHSEDFSDTKKIVKIDKDGFYYTEDGTRRKGKFHYMSNIYLTIKCDTSNFRFFKDNWDKKSLYGSRPTWEEYNWWALYPGMWDESGESTNGRIKSINWRVR